MTIGLIGAGHIGSQVARAAIAAGHSVVISNSRGPDTLAELVKELGPSARAARHRSRAGRRHRRRDDSAQEHRGRAGRAARRQDRDRHQQLLPAARRPHRGARQRVDDDGRAAAAHLPSSKVVKAFNHIYASQLTTDGSPPARRTAARWSSRETTRGQGDGDALLDEFGFDTVDAGPLSEGWRIQRDTPGYGPRRNAEQLRADLAAAKRYRDM